MSNRALPPEMLDEATLMHMSEFLEFLAKDVTEIKHAKKGTPLREALKEAFSNELKSNAAAENLLSDEDKCRIKEALLTNFNCRSPSELCDLARQLCEAVSVINRFDSRLCGEATCANSPE